MPRGTHRWLVSRSCQTKAVSKEWKLNFFQKFFPDTRKSKGLKHKGLGKFHCLNLCHTVTYTKVRREGKLRHTCSETLPKCNLSSPKDNLENCLRDPVVERHPRGNSD